MGLRDDVDDRGKFMMNGNLMMSKCIMAEHNNIVEKKAGVGRPKLGPTSKMRSMRLTNDEYDFVRWAVKQYRANVESIDVELFKKKV